MRYRLGTLLLLVALLPALAGCGGGGGGSSQVAGSGAGGTLGGPALDGSPSGQVYDPIPLAVQEGGGANPASEAPRYGVFVTDEGRSYIASAVKAGNPNCRFLLYEFVGGTAEASWRNDPIGNDWIISNHPEWFLRDGSGQKMHFADFPYIAAVDPGDPEYQRIWAQNAISIARAHGADGVFIDNCNTRYDWNFHVPPAKYPDQASYAAAMDSFVRYASATLKQAGLIVVGNGSGEVWNSGLWAQWNPIMDGRSTEPTPLWGGGFPQEVDGRWQDLYESFRSDPDKLYIQYLPAYSSVGEQNYRYLVASFLIWKGPHSYLGIGSPEGQPVPSDPLLEVRIGSPTEDPYRISPAVYKRDYQGGVVFVNSSSGAPANVDIPAGLNDDHGNPVAPGPRVLGAHDSLVLLKR